MAQFILLLAVVIFFSPSLFHFLRGSYPNFFSGSLLSPLVEKGVIADGKKDIIVMKDGESGVFSLGLQVQQIIDVTDFAFDPLHDDAIFAGTREGNLLYKYGKSPWFSLEGSGFLHAHGYIVRKILFDPGDANIVYILVSNHKEHGIVYSRNRGQSLEMLYTLSKEERVVDIAPMPGKIGALFAATEKGLLVSSADYGVSWHHVANFMMPIASLVVPASNPSSIFVVTSDGILHLSDNQGTDFRELSIPEGGLVKKVAPGNKRGRFFVMTDYNVYETKDGGANFTKVLFPITVQERTFSDISLSVVNDEILYVAFGTVILKSKDGGKNWEVKNVEARGIDELKISPANGKNAYIKVTY